MYVCMQDEVTPEASKLVEEKARIDVLCGMMVKVGEKYKSDVLIPRRGEV